MDYQDYIPNITNSIAKQIEWLNHFIKDRERTVNFEGTGLEYVLFAIRKWNQKHIFPKLTFFDLECTDDQLEILKRRYMTRRLIIPHNMSHQQLLEHKKKSDRIKPPALHQSKLKIYSTDNTYSTKEAPETIPGLPFSTRNVKKNDVYVCSIFN